VAHLASPWRTSAWAPFILMAGGAGVVGALGRRTTLLGRDLSDHRRSASELRRRLVLEDEVRSRERTTRHAMRNMVAGISMAAELLEEGDLDEPVRRRLEHTIYVEAVKLRGLLDDTSAARRAAHHDGSPTAQDQTHRSARDSHVPPVMRIVGETDVDNRKQHAQHA
jgi:hypothetical protein